MAIAADRTRRASEDAPEERDLHIAWLLGLTPARVRTMRRLHAKCGTGDDIDVDAVARRIGLTPRRFRCWRQLEELSDDELAAEVRCSERAAARSGVGRGGVWRRPARQRT